MRDRLKALKTVVEENPALVITTCHTVALAALYVVVCKQEVKTNLALQASLIAVKATIEKTV